MVVSHPHPRFGGNLHNKVTAALAQAARSAGWAALRYNFRGVGLSAGRYDEGRGEAADLRAVLSWVRRRSGGLPLGVAGFSFGAWITYRVAAEDAELAAVIGAGVPLRNHDVGAAKAVHAPKLVVQADDDPFGPIGELERWYEALPEPKRLVVIPGAGHFFPAHLQALARAVREFLEALVAAGGRADFNFEPS